MDAGEKSSDRKVHRERRAGRKADKKKEKNKHVQDQSAKERNPKAFAFNSVVKAQRNIARTADLKSKKHHIPVVNRTPLEPPPVLVAVVGGCKVGKSTLIRGLIKNYTRQKLSSINGPVTVVSGKKQRLTFLEVNNDINSMVDIAKVADVVLMLIDITLGIEMEVFEFLEICRAYGMPRVMGVLNHLDLMKDNKGLRKRKKELMHRFQVELYPGAKLFYLSGIIHEEYPKNEVSNLARFISVLKFRPLHFRSTHSYVMADRIEDITNAEKIRQNPVCDRSVVLYGYVRGIPMQPNQHVHIPGVGDCRIKGMSILDDPCPLPDKLKKRSLNAKERLMYAPMSGVSGVVYDKDAIYIDLGGSHHGRNAAAEVELAEDEKDLMQSLLQLQKTADEKTAESEFRLFSNSQPLSNDAVDEHSDSEDEDSDSKEKEEHAPQFETVTGRDGSMRRRVVFNTDVDDADATNESGIESDDSMTSSDEDEQDTEENVFPANKKKKTNDSVNMEVVSRSVDFGSSKFEEEMKDAMVPGFSKSAAISTKNYIAFLQNTIYGNVMPVNTTEEGEDLTQEDSEDEDFLFRKPKSGFYKSSSMRLPTDVDPNGLDSAKMIRMVKDWSLEETRDSIRDCFVTGEWNEKESAEKLLKMDAEDEDLYGDFEDLETGEKITAQEKEDEKEETGEPKKKLKSEMTALERRLEKKRKLKQMFDAEFDEQGKGDTFDALKEEMNEQAELNRMQFVGLDDEMRVKYEGFRAGLYVRMEFDEMNCELITNLDASYPIIIGGLLDNELNMGFVRARMKVHRWFPRILKNRDPLYLSIGWRRFQTLMFYAKREDNFRLRSLKYARKYLHVEVLFWGPIAETSSGFVAFQDINNKTSNFSIAANGVILEMDKSTQLVKKLKLIGHPEKIHTKTAFIKDMFHSDTEVTKFEGTKLQTQSSIRGMIKKSVGLVGLFRATFEDTIKMSDVVILTTWVTIDVPKFCSIVKNLLLPISKKCEWKGMKTNAQVKREKNIKNLVNPDSLYTEITERREHISMPVNIPKSLQRALPYKSKPKKRLPTKKKPRVIVVKDPEEVKMQKFMTRLKDLMSDKKAQQKEQDKKQKKEYKKKIAEREQLRQMREKKQKAFACKLKSTKKSKSLT